MAESTLTNNQGSNNQSLESSKVANGEPTGYKKYSPLSEPPWPQLPDSANVCLRDFEIGRLYRIALGILGLVRLLHRSTCLRSDVESFEDATDYPLNPFDEGNLWGALTELSADLVSLAEGIERRCSSGS